MLARLTQDGRCALINNRPSFRAPRSRHAAIMSSRGALTGSRTVLMTSFVAVLGLSGALGPARATDVHPRDRARERSQGALFVMTNSTDRTRGNEIVMYQRSRDGDLALIGYFPTGRLASGTPQLGSGPAPTSTVFGAPVPATADALGSAQLIR